MSRTAKHLELTSEQVDLLGKMSDRNVGVRLNCTAQLVKRARREHSIAPYKPPKQPWTAREIALLGKMSDAKVAARLDRPVQIVMLKRRELNIPAAKKIRANQGNNIGRWKWGPTELLMFYQYSDKEIAKITCRSLEDVKAKRAEIKSSKK